MLEAAQYADNCFVTLTYSEAELAKLPHVHGAASLEPKHLQDFLKRLRFNGSRLYQELRINEPFRIRYYAVGEYGDESQRPHFHLAIFNLAGCVHGVSDFGRGRECACARCSFIKETWGKGRVFVGTLELHSAQYVAGYVSKKVAMLHKDDVLLNGRHPEFQRMSLRPGIGHSALPEIASQLMSFNLENTQPDVPSALRHGGRLFPLGRYLRRELRKMVGKDGKISQAAYSEMDKELYPVRVAAKEAKKSVRKELLDRNAGRRARILARHNIFKGRRGL